MYSKPTESLYTRITSVWKHLNSRDSRRAALVSSEEYTHERFKVFMTVMFIMGAILRATAAAITFEAAEKVHATVLEEVVAYGTAAFSWNVGKWWLGVLVIHFVQYGVHVFHLMACLEDPRHQQEAIVNLDAYVLAHAGVLNFVIDLPGLFVPAAMFTTIAIILVNMAAVSMFVVLYIAEEPMSEAWGCYPVWFKYYQWVAGLCPAYLSKSNPENSLAPVCTEIQGAICDDEDIRWADTTSHAWTIAQVMLFVSLMLYAYSIPTKVEYYSVKFRQAIQIKS